jgi:hypothetical protein
MSSPGREMTLRQAALVAGAGLLLMAITTPFGETLIYSRLVVENDIAATARNIVAHRELFLLGVVGYLITFAADIVVTWALYLLFAPVNRSLSLLTAWFRLIYTAAALAAMLKLVTVLHLVTTAEYQIAFGADQLHAQVKLLLDSYRFEWSMSLVIFGAHLCLLGYLVFRSVYVPRAIGLVLVAAGLGWVISIWGPLVAPGASLEVVGVTVVGELIFMLWLLIRGRKLEHPALA